MNNKIKMLELNITIIIVVCMLSFRIHAQTENIYATSINHQGTLIAITTSDNQVQLHDIITGQLVRRLGQHSAYVSNIAWNLDDTLLASISRNGNIYVWDVNTGRQLYTFIEQEGELFAVNWLNNVQLITTSEGDGNSTVRIWDITKQQPLKTYKIGAILCIKLRPNNDIVAFGSLGGNIIELNTSTLEIYSRTKTLELNYINPIYQLSWHPIEGQIIASGHLDGQILIWDANTGHILNSLEGATQISIDAEYTHMIRALAFDPFGNTLRSINGEGLIRIWETQTWTLIAESHVPVPVYGADWSKDGNTVWYGSNSPDPVVYTVPAISTATPTSTLTFTPTSTATSTATDTPISTTTSTNTATPTFTETPSSTSTNTATATSTSTSTPTSTSTLTVTPTLVPTSTTSLLRLQYYPDPGRRSITVDSLEPDFRIMNPASSAIPLSEFKIRYYFTKEGTSPLVFNCWYTSLPLRCNNITGTFVTLPTPVNGADTYLEVGFTGTA